MVSRNTSSRREIPDKVVEVVDEEVKMVVVREVAVVVADKVVLATAVKAVAEDNKGVLESGISAVRGSQVRMTDLPRLTVHRGLCKNPMPLPAN